MSYQGIIKNKDGKPVADGKHNLKFKIYDAENEGELLWEEEQSLDLNNGIVNSYLGVIMLWIFLLTSSTG